MPHNPEPHSFGPRNSPGTSTEWPLPWTGREYLVFSPESCFPPPFNSSVCSSVRFPTIYRRFSNRSRVIPWGGFFIFYKHVGTRSRFQIGQILAMQEFQKILCPNQFQIRGQVNIRMFVLWQRFHFLNEPPHRGPGHRILLYNLFRLYPNFPVVVNFHRFNVIHGFAPSFFHLISTYQGTFSYSTIANTSTPNAFANFPAVLQPTFTGFPFSR